MPGIIIPPLPEKNIFAKVKKKNFFFYLKNKVSMNNSKENFI